MQTIREDMAKRNIKAEFIGIQNFYKDKITKEIDEIGLISKILICSSWLFVIVKY